MNTPSKDAALVAKHFCAVLREWLTAEQMQQIVKANLIEKINGNPNICHTHDYCDANMAMVAAFNRVAGLPDRDETMVDAMLEDTDTFNEAWAIASKADFKL